MKFYFIIHYFPHLRQSTDKIQYVQTYRNTQGCNIKIFDCENMKGRKMQVKMYISLDMKMYSYRWSK